jgi:(p)ppGpp synthase/HD superfamily hydrolase
MTGALGPRFDDALVLASDVHRQQRRKGEGEPYVAHLLAVCALVIEAGGDEDTAIAALLHDAVEDHPDKVTVASLDRRFGARVAHIVEASSDVVGHADPTMKPPWRQRKEAYLDRLATEDDAVLLVGVADKLHNLRSLQRELALRGPQAWTSFNAGPDEQRWYHRCLATIFASRLTEGRPALLAEEHAALVDLVWPDG